VDIVVGIDGSAGADAALGAAIEEARLRHARLRVVCAWEVPTLAYSAAFVPAELEEGLERAAEAVVADSLQRVGPPSDVAVEPLVVRGPAARVLLHAAEQADLLVVGSRGRGGFQRLLLGSVSHQAASHSPVPVMIVPPPDRRAAGAAEAHEHH
jgi:nucleotide-binding universal stress UspA family protein